MQTTLFALTLEAQRSEIARQAAARRKHRVAHGERQRSRWLKRTA